jgi:hypothetical protein
MEPRHQEMKVLQMLILMRERLRRWIKISKIWYHTDNMPVITQLERIH